jgi:hypothetical protein
MYCTDHVYSSNLLDINSPDRYIDANKTHFDRDFLLTIEMQADLFQSQLNWILTAYS